MALPVDYYERVYAGVLGKLIGVYLGRPFEGWSHERILSELGEINGYVNEKLGVPLVGPDDDIAGTFTFLRAMPDHGNSPDLTPAQIGQTWLNYLIEERSILWWGGLGNSTEHTAYLRLKSGIPAPRSGSIECNGKIIAEQIGAEIFIDGWAMISPGDPERAADLARRAASVSHDGEAVYAAQVIAAMEALAFVEPDLERLLDAAVGLIPPDSVIYRLISDLRGWRVQYPDWRQTRQQIVRRYGYDKFGGFCHVVPNHALVQLGLLYGEDSFQKSLMITNTSGWDTDCNSGNVGCLMGIKNGLAGIEQGPDWRRPVADRLFLPSADGGRCVTDAVTETGHIVNICRAMNGLPPLSSKGGARFHFELPGAVQGFECEDSPESRNVLLIENVSRHSQAGQRCLALRYHHLVKGRAGRAATSTFLRPKEAPMRTYELMASPSLYSGQVVRARLSAGEGNGLPVLCRLYISVYGADDRLAKVYGPEAVLAPGDPFEPTWQVPATGGDPIAEIGIELSSDASAAGVVYLDYLGWDGPPEVTFTRPAHNGQMWQKAWINAVDHISPWDPEPVRPTRNHGRGLLIQGCREWQDYQVNAAITPVLCKGAGIAAHVQGLSRFYAFMLCEGNKIRLVKALDGDQVLGESDFPWQAGKAYPMSLRIKGTHVQALLDGSVVFEIDDDNSPLTGGGIALVCEEGCFSTPEISVVPVDLQKALP